MQNQTASAADAVQKRDAFISEIEEDNQKILNEEAALGRQVQITQKQMDELQDRLQQLKDQQRRIGHQKQTLEQQRSLLLQKPVANVASSATIAATATSSAPARSAAAPKQQLPPAAASSAAPAASKKRTLSQATVIDLDDEAAEADGDSDPVMAHRYSIALRQSHLLRLQPGNWLDDEIINFWIEMLNENNQLTAKNKYHIINTFFFTKLMTREVAIPTASGGRKMSRTLHDYNYQAVSRWTAQIDIFALDMLIIPIHANRIHWAVAVINFKARRLEYYDSMAVFGGEEFQTELSLVFASLERFLRDEWSNKKNKDKQSPFPYSIGLWSNHVPTVPELPQQQTEDDCGVFVCMFCECIMRDIPFLAFGNQSKVDSYRQRMKRDIIAGTLSPLVS